MSQRSETDPFGWVGYVIDGKYRVDEVVGEGGFGIVYAGRHLGFDEAIAIKCLKLDGEIPAAKRSLFLQGFIAEGRILYRLSQHNPYIVRAIDVGAATSPAGVWTPYLILEWVRGGTLEADIAERARSSRGGRPIEEALDLLEPAARALEAAHAEGIAHRDVKPANLLLAEVQGHVTVKVMDFGVAKVMSAAAGPGAVTAAGTLVRAFSPAHGAPEQFDPKYGSTGPWTDVFALALVFVEVVLGRRAFDGENVTQFFIQSTNLTRRPTPRTLGFATSDAVERVLQRALAVDPRNRFQSAGELWDALGAAVHGRQQAPRKPGITTTVDSTAPVRTEIPEHPITIPGAPPQTMTQVPPVPLAIPVQGERSKSGTRAGETTVRNQKGGKRWPRRLGCLVALAALVGVPAVMVVEFWPQEREPVHPPVPPRSVPVVLPSPTSTAPPQAVEACKQPCCGGEGCAASNDEVQRFYDRNSCGPGGTGCNCGSGLACVPGLCRSTLPGELFELRLAGVIDAGAGKSNACVTGLRDGRVCVRAAASPSWQCARIGEACDADAGTVVGGARFGRAGMFVTAKDLTTTGLEVFIESNAGKRLACLDNGRHAGGIYLIGECVGVSYGALHRVAGTTLDSVTFYVTPAPPQALPLTAGVTLDPTPGTTASPACMSCQIAGGLVSCDGRDPRCESGCFTHSDCCPASQAGAPLLGFWKNYTCQGLGLHDPRCPP